MTGWRQWLKIAHISDLHFSSSLFVPRWAENVARTMEKERPDLLVVTGDLTNDGYASEFEAAKSFLDSLEAEDMLVVPGNHDSRNLGYTIFEEIFGPRFPTYVGRGVTVVGLDSTEPDVDDGHVGREHYGPIREQFNGQNIRILALHHHLIPIPGTGRERQIPTDAGDLLGVCKEVGVDIVLSGHKHLPWIWNLDGCFFITTATATTRRLKGRSRPAMGILEIEGRSLVLHDIKTDDLGRAIVLRTELRVR
jgi:3',5'-cyclic AMP phosphodiesterase CpdA